MPRKELLWQQITLQPIAWTAGRHHVGRIVRAAAGERMHMIKRGVVCIQWRRTVHTALSAVSQRDTSHGAFHRHEYGTNRRVF
jgi:hypothetical protein